MKILITGDRNWEDIYSMRKIFDELPKGTIIIHGAAKGADSMASLFAHKYGLIEMVYPAEWKKYGRAAGPIRNRQMFDLNQPDLVLAFHENIEESRGTADMICYAADMGAEYGLVESL